MPSFRASLTTFALGLACLGLASSPAGAAGVRGTLIETDNFGMNVATHRFDTKETTTLADAPAVSDFFGLHYYILDGLRIGLSFEFTSLLTTPPEGASRFTTFSLLPQVGWDFWGPMFAALIGTVSPRAYGKNQLELGFQGLLGADMALTKRLRGSLAMQVPVNLRLQKSIGLTVLTGLSYRF